VGRALADAPPQLVNVQNEWRLAVAAPDQKRRARGESRCYVTPSPLPGTSIDHSGTRSMISIR
jgi:hypothetical protein